MLTRHDLDQDLKRWTRREKRSSRVGIQSAAAHCAGFCIDGSREMMVSRMPHAYSTLRRSQPRAAIRSK